MVQIPKGLQHSHGSTLAVNWGRTPLPLLSVTLRLHQPVVNGVGPVKLTYNQGDS